MSNLMAVHEQWKSRPDDERYLSLDELERAVLARRHGSRESRMALDTVSVMPAEDGSTLVLSDGKTFEAPFTHYSFGQMAQRLHVPSQFLRELPTELAALNCQWALEHKLDDQGEGRGAKLLLGASDAEAPRLVRAVTGPDYGRIWDADVVAALRRNIGPEWKVPGASYASANPKLATTLYASDRDVFVFLVNESKPVELAGGDRLHRGFYIRNSEVGAATCELVCFYYRYVCDNRIVWGAEEVHHLRIRHTSGAPERFIRDASPKLKGLLNASTAKTVDVLKKAQGHELGKDRDAVVSFLRGRGFGAGVSAAAYDRAGKDGLNPRTLWGVVQGLTSEAQALKHTDSRIERERDAGALLDLIK